MAQEILLKDGTRISRQDLLQREAAKKESVQKKEEIKEEVTVGKSLDKMNKAELVKVAEEQGLDVSGLTKSQILELLMGDEDETGL